jgi:flavin reductase (DIM6/NTAB) family NADH-FMN oxidoreductase RutF
MTIEKDFFRRVMGHFTTGVTVVTTSSQGELGGLTVNAFCSVSLNPPLVLVCIDLQSQTLALIRESQVFAVNLLTDKQEALSRCFATRSRDRFECFCYASYSTAVTGAPILDDVLAFIDARVVAEYPGGDHVIFLGQVVAMGTENRVIFADDADEAYARLPASNGTSHVEARAPLVYYEAKYRHLANQYQVPSLTPSSDEERYEQQASKR